MILLHTCCGPCALYPILELQKEGEDVHAFFYNSNIQPASEFLRRHDGAKTIAQKYNVKFITGEYDPTTWLSDVHTKKIANTKERCTYCYETRLEACAKYAKENGYKAFSTSLLYSKFQNHELLKELGEKFAKKYNIDFYYADWRIFWQDAIDLSKELEIYRQNYCACIFSELERYEKKLNKIFK